jgi:hypothetical protein
MLPELHDLCAKLLWERFDPSHDINRIDRMNRFIKDFPKTDVLVRKLFSSRRLESFMDEGKPHPISWYFMILKEE